MNKTPEEIKKGMKLCKPIWKGDHWKTCDEKCPYRNEGSLCREMLNSDALALIQRLEAEVPKWISVDESMPDGFVPVLGHIIDAFNFPHVRECYRVEDAFYFPELRDIHTISHWMPLPELPKEEEK